MGKQARQRVLGLEGQRRGGDGCVVFCRKLLGAARDGGGGGGVCQLASSVKCLVMKIAGHVVFSPNGAHSSCLP